MAPITPFLLVGEYLPHIFKELVKTFSSLIHTLDLPLGESQGHRLGDTTPGRGPSNFYKYNNIIQITTFRSRGSNSRLTIHLTLNVRNELFILFGILWSVIDIGVHVNCINKLFVDNRFSLSITWWIDVV